MDNSRRFVYFYLNRNETEKIRQVVLAHIQYWKVANLQGYMGAPFADRSGGLISFVAASGRCKTCRIVEAQQPLGF